MAVVVAVVVAVVLVAVVGIHFGFFHSTCHGVAFREDNRDSNDDDDEEEEVDDDAVKEDDNGRFAVLSSLLFVIFRIDVNNWGNVCMQQICLDHGVCCEMCRTFTVRMNQFIGSIVPWNCKDDMCSNWYWQGIPGLSINAKSLHSKAYK